MAIPMSNYTEISPGAEYEFVKDGVPHRLIVGYRYGNFINDPRYHVMDLTASTRGIMSASALKKCIRVISDPKELP